MLQRPTSEDLRKAADSHHLHLSEADERAYAALFEEFLPHFDALDAMPDPFAGFPPRGRESWTPSPGENPYNAILRRCRVRGAGDGPLAGKRVGLKDSIALAGVEMSLGSPVIRGYRPAHDSTLVERLLAAGAEIVAVVNMDAFAHSGAGDTSLNGPTLNPHDTSRTAGGSSGGSAAALFHDDIDLTFGTDQGGSVRIPASWCGVVGMKPTFGLVPYTGIAGLDRTYDHVGPLAHRAADVAQALEAIAGRDLGDSRQDDMPYESYPIALREELRGVRIGVVREGFGLSGGEADVDAVVRAALDRMASLGASVEEVSIPMHLHAGPIAWGLFAEAVSATYAANGLGNHWRGVYDPQMAVAFGEGMRARADLLPPQGKLQALLGTYLRDRFQGRFYAKAQNLRVALRAAYDEALRIVDILAMPTTIVKAQPYRPDLDIVERVLTGWCMLGNTAGFNMTGHPSLSVPCGVSDGLPVGLMLTGRHFEDAQVLAAAHALQTLDGVASPG